MNFFEQLNYEIVNMDLGNFIVVSIFFIIPFLFSLKADAKPLRVFYLFIAIYMLFTLTDSRVLYDLKMIVALGLLLAQIKFMFYFIHEVIVTIKMASVNSFYFFLTIYYKIVRLLKWIKSTFETLKIFFTNINTKKEHTYSENQDKYQEQEEYKSYQEEDEKEQEDYNSNKKYEETSQEQNYSYERKEDKEEQTHKEEPKKETKNHRSGFEQYFSQSAYTVLGVNVDDDFKTIKKTYRKLAREFHPDLHPDKFDFYNEIMGNINVAYAKLEKINN